MQKNVITRRVLVLHSYLFTTKRICWPCYVSPRLRKYTSFIVRRLTARPLHALFNNIYSQCVVCGCNASRGAFREFVVSPYCVQHACEWSCPKILYFKAQ